MENVYSNWFLFCLALSLAVRSNALPVGDDAVEETTEAVNKTLPQDLYVIRTIVYEVGILTEADNETSDNSTEISHQVDLTFFDPKFNGSAIDLSNIPLPVQTNISGVTITGLAPANLGSVPVPPPGESTLESASDLPIGVPVLPAALVEVRHNVSTTNPEKGVKLLSEVPGVLELGLTSEKTNDVE